MFALKPRHTLGACFSVLTNKAPPKGHLGRGSLGGKLGRVSSVGLPYGSPVLLRRGHIGQPQPSLSHGATSEGDPAPKPISCRLDPRLWNPTIPSRSLAGFAVAAVRVAGSAQARPYRPTAAKPEPCGTE